MTPSTRLRTAALLLALSLPVGLAGCAGPSSPEPTPTVSETDATEPVFASDEEALAAAVEAYERYLDVSAEVGADGGADAERILEVTDGAIARQSLDDYASMRKLGVHFSGRPSASNYELVQHSGEEIQAYVCLDVEKRRVMDQTGADITPADRDLVVPMLLTFSVDPSIAMLTGSELWSGDDFC